jgi:RNA-directed DNA polymerase
MGGSNRDQLARALASAFLAEGAWARGELVARGEWALGERPRWLGRVASRVLAHFQDPPRGRLRELTRFIARLRALREAGVERPTVRRWLIPVDASGTSRWAVPSISTLGDLAAWLGLTPGELEWFVDERGLERLAQGPLRHYTYRWVSKRPDGSGGARLLEAPKKRMKALQRRVLREILDRIPPHDAVHGFRRGRSVRTHAQAHAGRQVVVRVDLADFFLSLSSSRVAAVFRSAGYGEEVAHALACLCTNRAPVVPRTVALGPYAARADLEAWRRAEALARTRHLPQGAPTSPALANLCAFGLDVRLAAAASAVAATYTRYADDLVFSGDGDFAQRARRFEALVGAIVLEEGLVVNHRKTLVMRAGGRQLVTGLVVNQRANVPRETYDRVRAILHNCETHGPASQNRDGREDFRAYVRGLVAWIADLDPARGAGLLEQFRRLRWA